jgi:hypothetical protein
MLFTPPNGPISRLSFAARRPMGWFPVKDDTDLHTQLEDLLGHVRRCEKWARFDDRLDLISRLEGKS